MVTLDPPVLVTVSERDLLLPRVMLPKLRLVGFAPSAPAVTPVPVRGMVRDGLEPLEVMVTEPVALPAGGGVTLTFKVALLLVVIDEAAVMPIYALSLHDALPI